MGRDCRRASVTVSSCVAPVIDAPQSGVAKCRANLLAGLEKVDEE